MNALKILIVEDQRIVATNIKEYLSEIGYHVQTAHDYKKGIEAFYSFKPDLVLLDIQLSKDPNAPDGIDLASQIAANGMIPFIFLTGNAENDDLRTRAKSVNHSGFLVKPPNMLQIEVAIEMVIEKNKNDLFPVKDYFFVKDGKAYHRIDLQNLGWIKANRNLSELYLIEGKQSVSTNLAALERSLQNPSLKRIHKSYIINTAKITRIKGNSLYLKIGNSEEKVTIGRIYRDEFWEYFENTP